MQKIEFTLDKHATELIKFLINLSIMRVIRYLFRLLHIVPISKQRNLLKYFQTRP